MMEGSPAFARDETTGSKEVAHRLRQRWDDPERAAREAAWLAENAAAIAAWNDYVDRHGLPLASFSPL